jgi:endonuclease/exonuclease/phosphatase family metal-dependent hydrolase
MHYCDYHALKSDSYIEYHFLNHLKAWDFLVDQVKPDIAFLQEANPVSKHQKNFFFKKSHTSNNGELVQWGTGIYISDKIKKQYEIVDNTDYIFPEKGKFDGKTICLTLKKHSEKDLCLVSLHTDTKDYDGESPDITVDHLKYIFNSNLLKWMDSRFIIGGDFNIDSIMEDGKYKNIFDEFAQKDIISAFERHEQTFFGNNQDKKSRIQDDHIFVHPSMKKLISDSFVWNYGLVKKYSDHTIIESSYDEIG